MTKVTLDAQTIRALTEPGAAEVCDQSGQSLGYFIPPDLFDAMIRRMGQPLPKGFSSLQEYYAWAKTQVPREVLDRAAASTEWGTTEELLRLIEERK